ncbi:MAG: hypothetical protein AAGA95_18210 [Pseudomonadota bacterium]
MNWLARFLCTFTLVCSADLLRCAETAIDWLSPCLAVDGDHLTVLG